MGKLLYEIFYQTEKRDNKSKNGDSLNIYELVEDHLVVLCVSDGVGSLSKDWLASETTCKTFTEQFVNCSGTIESRLHCAVLSAHSAVLNLSNQSSMAATLIAVVVDFNKDRIYYLSIGDSRIFIVDSNGAKLITEDNTMSIPVKINNEFIVNNGVPVYSFPITKAIGQNEKLEFEIYSKPFNAGESIVLATDGIHNHGLLPSTILDLINQKNIEANLQSVVSECSRQNNDDATILILRRNDFPNNTKSLYEDAILNNIDYKLEKLYAHLLSDCAIDLFYRTIEMEEWEKAKKCLEYIYEKKLLPSKVILIGFLDLVITQNTKEKNIQNLLRKLIQISS